MKRILSIILAIAMLATFVPATFAAEEVQLNDSGVKVTYDLHSVLYDNFWEIRDSMKVIDYELTNGFFAFKSNNGGNGHYEANTSGYFAIDESKDGTKTDFIGLADWAKVSFGIYIPKAGKYNFKMYNVVSNNPNLKDKHTFVYLNKDGISTAEADLIGKYTCYDETKSVVSKVAEPNVFAVEIPEAGTYTITFATDTAKWHYNYVSTFELDGGNGLALMGASLSISKRNANVSAVLSDGSVLNTSELRANGATVKYKSSDSSIAAIDESTGVITNIQEGKVTITATVTFNGTEVEAQNEYSSTKLAAGITVKYDLAGQMAKQGLTWGATESLDKITHDETNGFFQFVAGTYKTHYSDRLRFRPNNLQIREDIYLAFEVYVPKAGTYTMKMENGVAPAANNPQSVDVYKTVGRYNSATFSPTGGEFEGTYDCIGNDTDAAFDVTANPPKEIDGIEIPEAGYYVFSFSTHGKAKYYTGSVGSFSLVEGDGSLAVVMGTELETKTGTAVLKTFMSDGVVLTASQLKDMGAEITYAGTDSSIAAVDTETGKINDIAPGKITVTATVVFNGDTFTAEDEYTSLIAEKGIGAYYNLHSAMTAAGTTTENVNAGKDPGFAAINYDKTGGMFRVVASTNAAHKSGQMVYQTYPEGNTVAFSDGRIIAFEVYVPRAGVYDMEMYHGANDKGLDVEVFVSRNEASTDASDMVGSYSCYDAGVSYSTAYFSEIVKEPSMVRGIRITEPGYYVLTFKATDGIDGDTNWIYGDVGSFRLVSGKEEVLAGIITEDDAGENKPIIVGVDNNTIEYTDPDNRTTMQINVAAENLNGDVLDITPDSVTFASANRAIATVDKNGVLTPVGDGETEITVNAVYDGAQYSAILTVIAYDNTGLASAEIALRDKIYVRDIVKPTVKLTMNSGNKLIVPIDEVQLSVVPEGIIEITDGMLKANLEGTATVSAYSDWRELSINASKEVTVELDDGKSEPTYYTAERRANAAKNIAKYSWAASTKKAAVNTADKYITQYERIYDMIIPEGLPRAMRPAGPNDPEWIKCRYCNVDINAKYGGWSGNPLQREWKIQCPDCKRLFPSNNFGEFYKLGVDSAGNFDRLKALEAHRAMLLEKRISLPDGVISDERRDAISKGELLTVAELEYYGYGVEGGYLVNELYSDLDNVTTINSGQGLREGETVETWGVDDGWGYIPRDDNGNAYLADPQNGILERHCYIATYNYKVWGVVGGAIEALANAYLYTGTMKYGRAGAILLDRVADVYPSFDLQKYHNKGQYLWWLACGGSGYGKIQGQITDNVYANNFALWCDAFYPVLFEDSQVVSFLSEKSEKLGLSNSKSTSAEIWENWENGILRENFINAKDYRIEGNFGLVQATIAATAVVLDKEPESSQMIEWIFKTGGLNSATHTVTGGNVLSTMVDIVDRNGMGAEAADGYNIIWITGLGNVAEYLSYYKGDVDYNLYNHPKFGEMLVGYDGKMLTNSQTANVGDARDTAQPGFNGAMAFYNNAFMHMKDGVYGKRLAQYIYTRYGFDVEGIRTSLFDDDAESIQNEILSRVIDNPEQISGIMAGYGLSVLRDGGNYESASAATNKNTLRDFWIYFGQNDGHGHDDTLNIGIDAYGFDLAPDLGYPAITGTDPERLQWTSVALSHNTVLVDEETQKANSPYGVPLHFDDSGNVKLMDIDASSPYPQTENYRRTVVMVKANDDVSYGVDFFRVTGGNTHTYSFHAQAENAYPVEGLDMTEQKDEQGNWIGSYVGVNVPYTALDGTTQYFTGPGRDPWTQDSWFYNTCFPRGYTWLSKVRRDSAPENKFAVEFDVKDYRKLVSDSDGIKLRITQLNDFTADEVAITAGPVPEKAGNKMMPKNFDYVLVQHRGENIDSLFTTVFEPYKGERYIENIEAVDVRAEEKVSDEDKVYAIKVIRTDGKRDYIVYASNNSVTYTVMDNTLETPFAFDFRGFVGVLTVNAEGAVIYRYVNDGDVIGEATNQTVGYTGTIVAFDKDYGFDDYENWIDIKPTVAIDPAVLSGKYIYIENDGKQPGVYKIESASDNGDGTLRLDIGTITLVRSYADSENFDAGYIYNIEEEQSFNIPLSFEESYAPEFGDVSNNLTTSADSSISVSLNAESPIDKAVTYKADTLPRGASLNESTGIVTWKPDSSQIGENHFAITARDSDGRESTVHFMITVYGSTTGKPEADNNTSTGDSDVSGEGASTEAGGGGGGGGGGATPDTNKTDESEDTGDDENGEKTPEASGETDSIRFTDISNHSWAADAINSLADEGIIKGTTPNTFSPAANITRADFAILLVRAFELASENEENFADVSESDYFAKELAIARNVGIVGGVGDNKFAPRNNITRQDMMLIVYRALIKLGVELESADVAYEDFSSVAEYAQEAVKTLITNGIVNGKNGRVAPVDYTTRAEIAVLIKRTLDFIGE